MVPRETYQQINSESTYRYLVFFGEDTLYLSFLPKVNWFEQGEFGYDFQEAHTLSHQIKQKLTHRKNSWKGKRLESSFNTWGDCCSGAIGRGEGGGLAWGVKPNPWIVAAYWKCILLLNSPSRSGLHCNCTFTPCRHGTKRREVRYAPCSSTPACLLAPKHKLYCFGGKTKIFRSTTCSPQRGAPTCLGSRHWLLGGVQGTLGKCSTPGCCTLPCVQQNQDNNIGDCTLWSLARGPTPSAGSSISTLWGKNVQNAKPFENKCTGDKIERK